MLSSSTTFSAEEVAQEFYTLGAYCLSNTSSKEYGDGLRRAQNRIADLLAKKERIEFNAACGMFYA